MDVIDISTLERLAKNKINSTPQTENANPLKPSRVRPRSRCRPGGRGCHVSPRDWPPRGWEVDRKELEFIREAHKFSARVDLDQVKNGAKSNTDDLCLDRYKVFLKQYNEWIDANRDRLEEEPLICNYPYVNTLWQIHAAEQMIMDDMEINPDKYKGKKLSEPTDDEEFNEENNVQYIEDYYKDSLLPKTIMNVSVKDLDFGSCIHNELKSQAMEKVTEWRNHEMDEYDLVHW